MLCTNYLLPTNKKEEDDSSQLGKIVVKNRSFDVIEKK